MLGSQESAAESEEKPSQGTTETAKQDESAKSTQGTQREQKSADEKPQLETEGEATTKVDSQSSERSGAGRTEDKEYDSSLQINLADSEFSKNYIANHQTVYNQFSDKQYNKEKLNQASEREFPKPSVDLALEEADLLDKRRQFYRENHWLMIESNDENRAFVSSAIATLIAYDDNCQFLCQVAQLKPEDYIAHAKDFACKTPSITRIRFKDTDALTDFFEAPENVTKLTETLKKGNNTLIMVLQSETSGLLKTLVNRLGGEDKVSYWCPKLKPSDANLSQFDEPLNWLDKTILALCCWFNGMPYNMLHRVILEILEQRQQSAQQSYEQLKAQFVSTNNDEQEEKNDEGEHSAAQLSQYHLFTQWLHQWRNEPDVVLERLGITNRVSTDEQSNGIRFVKPEHQQFCRELIQSTAAFHIQQIIPAVVNHILNIEQRDHKNLYSDIFNNLALFLNTVHRQKLFNFDSEFLLSLFNQCRYIHTRSFDTMNRFVDLLLELVNIARGKEVVSVFIEGLAGQIVQQQERLMAKVEFNIKLLDELPKSMAELAEKAAKEEIAEDWYKLKDLLYATYIILDKLGLSRIESLMVLERILASDFGSNKAGVDQLPCANLILHNLFNSIKYNSGLLHQMLVCIQEYEKGDEGGLFHVRTIVLLNVLQLLDAIKTIQFSESTSPTRALMSVTDLLGESKGAASLTRLFMLDKIPERMLKALINGSHFVYLCSEMIADYDEQKAQVQQAVLQLLKGIVAELSREPSRRLLNYWRAQVNRIRELDRGDRANKQKREYWQRRKQAAVFVKKALLSK